MEKKDIVAIIVGGVLVAVTLIACLTYYNIKRDEGLKSNIESAIVKGIDPISVRCAYGRSDNLCLAYALSIPKK